MNSVVDRSKNIKSELRRVIMNEWRSYGHFPCYAFIDIRGERSFQFADLINFMMSRADPFLRAATLLCWPLRLKRILARPSRDGVSLPVPTRALSVLRFHTFFTDYYFYGALKRMLRDEAVRIEEKETISSIIVSMIELILRNKESRTIQGEEFKVFKFFPKSEMQLSGVIKGRRFLSLTGLGSIDPDADDTFIILEMFHDIIESLQVNDFLHIPAHQRKSLNTSLAEILKRPYWILARHYQYRTDGLRKPKINYVSVQASGGITTWFAKRPIDAPDLVVNVNVLRSLLINYRRWSVIESIDALEVVRGIISFLWQNVSNGLFRTDRGYCFYITEFFCAMFARLWRVFLSFSPAQRYLIDPHDQLSLIRREILSYIRTDLDPLVHDLNPLDSSLALMSAIQLGEYDEAMTSRWIDVICRRFESRPYPFRAYEIFRGKIPTLMVYGSEATTSALVYESLDEWNSALGEGLSK